ncbi:MULTISPECIES: MBL fold metallo-hydrolase [Bacillus cereus group]|uniref:MBL fold metallo-hydrolase n=1 Tax=Bacillus proteolyticus TaxID=2026192 RepID=A0ABV3IIJ8_9BACI|nr:MBL fold metallo-hydrolase [Bacillus cereus group sp. N8]MBJ8107952.1 MBL fold metallo-hydrolase [Bacillus cereus group sp. N8]
MEIIKEASSYFSIEKLSEGIYAAIAKKGEGAMGNAGFIDLGNGVLIFDTFTTPKAAKDLRKVAEEITQKEIKYVFNSHYHGDHTFGNQIFEDVIIISTSITRDLHAQKNIIQDLNKEQIDMQLYLNQLEQKMITESDPVLLASLDNQFKEMSKVNESLSELRIVLPNLTFEDKLVIHGTCRTVELYCYGGGHTPSDAFLYLPQESIAFMGDLVLENLHPPIFSSQQFIDNLSKVDEMDIQKIVPGHGNLVTKDQIKIMLQYLEHLNIKVASSLEKREALDQLLLTNTPKAYANWSGVDGYKRNLTVIYNEYKEK